jgi:FkbM family methyltransferase|tara:strand:+ start:1644 stop:2309 length:666 start_codon:yes stop_codon:yes gene_type:complete
MSVLVYVGANEGTSLSGMVHGYERVYAFEPDPITFQTLKSRLGNNPNITLVNAACAEEEGETDFFILPCRASSSMSIPDDDFIAHCENEGNLDAIEVSEPITVKTINLCEYLQGEGVTHIDYYVSDIQGFDLKVLKTMSPYLESGDIDELYMETHGDNQKCYVGLTNDLSSFKELLSDTHEIEYISLGRFGGRRIAEEGLDSIPQQNDKGELEFDVKWKKK